MRSNLRAGSLLLVAALACGAAFAACGDDGYGTSDATRTPRSTTTTALTPANGETAAPSSPGATAAAEAEVQGIVGSVNANDSTITISRLSGAAVTRIAVSPTTRIRQARGGTARLADIKPSDRIIASGTVEGSALRATEITIEAVVPGAAPGG